MSLVVVGSIALDTIETPTGRADNALGGSGTHFALAAALLSEVRLMGYVGEDFPREHVDLLAARGIDLAGLVTKPGKTFRWSGRYMENMNVRETLSVDLNVFGEYEPEVPEAYADSRFVFLANGAPAHQMKVIEQMTAPDFVVLDTMDHWIESSRADLDAVFKRVDGVVVNDSEAHLLTGRDHVAAAQDIIGMGPGVVIVKKGEHGAVMVTGEDTFLIPAYPIAELKDPTGAGDSFAGGMMGCIAREGAVTPDILRKAIAYGTVIASFNVEGFGVNRLAALTLDEVEERLAKFREMLRF